VKIVDKVSSCSRRNVDFRITLTLLITVSILAFSTPCHVLLLITLVISLIAVYISSSRDLLQNIKYFSTFITPLISISLILQVAIGILDFSTIAVAILRIYTLYITAFIVSRTISVKNVIDFARKYRLTLVIAILLAFKLTRYSTSILTDISDIYSTNIGFLCVNIVCRTRLTIMKMKAFSQLLIVKALEVGEAIYTRYPTIVYQERSSRRKIKKF
jgi:hypothetical protein